MICCWNAASTSVPPPIRMSPGWGVVFTLLLQLPVHLCGKEKGCFFVWSMGYIGMGFAILPVFVVGCKDCGEEQSKKESCSTHFHCGMSLVYSRKSSLKNSTRRNWEMWKNNKKVRDKSSVSVFSQRLLSHEGFFSALRACPQCLLFWFARNSSDCDSLSLYHRPNLIIFMERQSHPRRARQLPLFLPKPINHHQTWIEYHGFNKNE